MSYYAGGNQVTNPYGDVAGYEAPPPDSMLTTISETLSSIPKRNVALLLAAGGTAAVAWWITRTRAPAAKAAPLHVHALTGAQGGGAQMAGWVPTEEDVERIRKRLSSSVQLTHGPEPAPGTQILLSAFPTEKQLLSVECSLQAVLIPFAGIPLRTEAAMVASGLAGKCAVHSVHHNAPMTAELAVALALSAAKQIIPADKQLRRGDWSARGIPSDGPPAPSVGMMILQGKSCLIVGLGEVGSRVAVSMQALGMNVHATRASATKPHVLRIRDAARAIDVHPPSHLRALLPSASILFLCVPGNAQTDGMIGAQELSLLPPGAVVVNVGRAGLLDEDALFRSLSPGPSGKPHLLGAGIDVWYNYPSSAKDRGNTKVSSKNAFDTLPNVVMSPHRGGAVGLPETEEARLTAICSALNTAAAKGARALPGRIQIHTRSGEIHNQSG